MLVCENLFAAFADFVGKFFDFGFDDFAVVWAVFLDPFNREIFAEDVPVALSNAVAFEEFFVKFVLAKILVHF